MDGWNTIVSFWETLFSGAFAVSFREGVTFPFDSTVLKKKAPRRETCAESNLNSPWLQLAYPGVGMLSDHRMKGGTFSGWWFQICFMFTPTWGHDPIWLIFFKWVETTNQFWMEPIGSSIFQASNNIPTWGTMTIPQVIWKCVTECVFPTSSDWAGKLYRFHMMKWQGMVVTTLDR